MPFLKNKQTSQLSDAALVEAFQQTTDLAVLGALYERYMDLVYGVCLYYFKDSERAKDSVLSVFEELIVKVQKHAIENFRGWLYQLAKNHCLMQLRSDKKLRIVTDSAGVMHNDEIMHLETGFENNAQLDVMQHCLAQLNGQQRQAIELFYLQGKPYKEIGAVMGIDVNTVRSFLQNGRRNLKVCMDKKMSAT